MGDGGGEGNGRGMGGGFVQLDRHLGGAVMAWERTVSIGQSASPKGHA